VKARWTEQALERLQEIEDFISQRAPETAARFVNRLINRGDRAAAFPNAGRAVPELGVRAIREVLEGNYRIVYRTASHSIDILTVFEGHREFPSDDVNIKK